jgi:cysteine desulfuration protein SufE
MADIDEIIGNFTVLDDWDDRYRYLIELGRELPPLPEAVHSDANKVQGCASQVWLDTTVRPNGTGGPVLIFAGDSDAHIVRGLIATCSRFIRAKAQERFSAPMPSNYSKAWVCANTSRHSARMAFAPWSSAFALMPVLRWPR